MRGPKRNPWNEGKKTLSPGGATDSVAPPGPRSNNWDLTFQGFRSLRSLHPWLPSVAPPGLRHRPLGVGRSA
jgi:hypothetical protein